MNRNWKFTFLALNILLGLAMVMLAGVISAVAQAPQPNAVKVLWSKPCEGDRVVVLAGLTVRCVKDVPPPLPTPTPAPTMGILSTEPAQTPPVCGDDPDYWTSCPPYP